MEAVLVILSLVPFYLIGAFPSGRLVGKLWGIDITREGSGNVGATNLARVLGKKAGLITLLIDISKGFASCLIAAALVSDPDYQAWAGLAAIVGHCFSLPPIFTGGKGVATTAGVFLWLSPISLLFAVVLFALVYAKTRVVSLASVSAALALPLPQLFLQEQSFALLTSAALAALVVIYRHKQNLKRLSEGREEVFQVKKVDPS